LKASEKLNERIYQQFAKEMGSDPVVNSFLTLVAAVLAAVQDLSRDLVEEVLLASSHH
jgi:hypothetical protein